MKLKKNEHGHNMFYKQVIKTQVVYIHICQPTTIQNFPFPITISPQKMTSPKYIKYQRHIFLTLHLHCIVTNIFEYTCAMF